MGSAAFDTLKAAKQLGEDGFSQQQAESLAAILGESINDKLATKDDLEDLEKHLTSEIKLVQKDLKVLDTKIDTGLAALDDKIDSHKEALEVKIGAVDQKLDSTKETLEAKIDGSVKMLEAQMREQTAQLGEQIANGFADVAERQVVQMRWMIASIIGSIGVLVAAYAAFQ